MQIADLAAQRRFASEKMQKVPVFTSDKLFFDQYCLRPGQAQRVHSHAGEDKVYVVLDGEATFAIGGEEATRGPGFAAFAPAGTPHGVRNDTDADLVLLVAMAPRPDRP